MIFHTADFHIGCLKAKLGVENALNRNRINMAELLSNIIKQQPTFLIISGDCFNTSNPTKEEIRIFLSFLLPILTTNIIVFIVEGNHDEGTTSALDFLLPIEMEFKNLHIAKNFKVVSIGNFDFGLYGYNRSPKLRDKKHYRKSSLKLCVHHIPIEGVRLSNNRKLKGGRSYAEFIKIVKNIGFSKCYLGDIHEWQRKGKIFYSGATLQTKFDESKEKGYLLHGKRTKFVKLENTPKLLYATQETKIRNDHYYVYKAKDYKEAKELKALPNIVSIDVEQESIDLTQQKVKISIDPYKVIEKVLGKELCDYIKSQEDRWIN